LGLEQRCERARVVKQLTPERLMKRSIFPVVVGERGSTQDQHTLLIAGTDPAQWAFLAGQLDADGHTANEADHAAAMLAKLSGHA
jgi:hypothetical protein